MDLLQGHYIVSVNRDMAFPTQPKGLEAFAVSELQFIWILNLTKLPDRQGFDSFEFII